MGTATYKAYDKEDKTTLNLATLRQTTCRDSRIGPTSSSPFGGVACAASPLNFATIRRVASGNFHCNVSHILARVFTAGI